MILGFLGKGGSGKSSVSWLVTKLLEEKQQKILCVDADHNMDLSHLLGMTVDEKFPTLHRAHDQFREAVGQKEDKNWADIVLGKRSLQPFSLLPKDPFTAATTRVVNDQVDLMVVGLGAEDVLFSSRCAHGHSAPLKYYLPLLSLKENEWSVIDGVAGVDMMHFGLFNGVDRLIIVVEPHPNSIRVYREITRIAKESELPLSVVINKSRPSEQRATLLTEVGDDLLFEVPVDTGILEYDFDAVDSELKETIWNRLQSLEKNSDEARFNRLRAFEEKRQAAKVT